MYACSNINNLINKQTITCVCIYSLILTVVSGRAGSVWAGPGVVGGGDGARDGVAGGAGRSNRWKAVKETRMAWASAAPNTQAASAQEEERCLVFFKHVFSS